MILHGKFFRTGWVRVHNPGRYEEELSPFLSLRLLAKRPEMNLQMMGKGFGGNWVVGWEEREQAMAYNYRTMSSWSELLE